MTSTGKPRNADRRLPTVTVALPPVQIERLRELAWARNISVSQIAREALDLAFARWEHGDEPPAPWPRLGGGGLLTHWPRELRRAAARDGRLSPERDA